jgi:hypothetical protein
MRKILGIIESIKLSCRRRVKLNRQSKAYVQGRGMDIGIDGYSWGKGETFL